MRPNITDTLKSLLKDELIKVESAFNADAFCYYGPLMDNNENFILQLIENLPGEDARKERLVVILTTGGGSATAVERYVNILRHHYNIVDFIVPNFAFSAGTIFCMSGDNIYMDYSSALGPIDPQIQNKEGRFVAALGYLDKVNELIQKSTAGTLTDAEFIMMRDLDLAELRSYEQSRDLTVDLLKQWLAVYKFKNWDTHHTTPGLIGHPVTPEEKVKRAEEIAARLSDTGRWKIHNRAINIKALNSIGLKIEDYSNVTELREPIRDYFDLLTDYVVKHSITIFVQTRNSIFHV